MVWDILKSLFTGNILNDGQNLWKQITQINWGDLAQAWLGDFEKQWNHPAIFQKWQFRGKVLGYAAAEIALAVLTFGGVTGARWAGKMSTKAIEVIKKIPGVAKLAAQVSKIPVPARIKKGLQQAYRGVRQVQLKPQLQANMFRISDIKPLFPHWYIQALSAPSNIILGAGFTNPDPQISQVPHLSPDVLFNWIRNSLEQDSPNIDYRITWRLIRVSSTRTRLFNKKKFQERQSLLLNSDAGELNIPIERLEEDLWVSGPVEEISIEPPITLYINQEYGGLSAKLMIHWSLWTQPDQPEQIALQAAISRLLNKGWEKS